ncbi:MAG: PAS domain S-box protein, partial [Methanobacterium sp.]
MESEEKYRRIVETANEGIWAIDENFKTTFVNQRMAEMLGYTAPEMIGMQFTFFMFEEDLKEHDVKSEPQGFPERFERKFKHKDGSEIWAKVSSTPLKDESGSFAMFTDITKEKRMENTLKESEELYKMLFENSNVCTAITTMNGTVINANHNFFEMTGYHPEEINQINMGNMYQNIDQRNDLIEILKKEGKARDYEVKMIRNDNQPYVASINVDLILNHHVDAMLVTAIDITEQKKSQIALECSESRLRELFNNMSSGVAVYDVINNSSDFIFNDFNKAAERIENLRKDDVIGKNVLEIFPGIKDFGLFAVLQRVWRTGIAEHFPTSFYKDQRIIGWRDNYIYKLPSGEIVAVYDDVTEQMNAEEALKESEEKYRQVFNKANDMISLNLMNGDMPGNFIEINNIGVQRLGYSKEELLNMSPKDIVAPDKRSEMPENVRQLNEKGHNTFEIVHITKDGKMIPIEVNNHLISFNGQAVCLAISRDITERKKVEEQIKTERQKLLDIIEFLPNATFVIDEDKNIIAWNKAIEKMTGISKKEMIGKGNHEYSIPFYGIRRPVLIDLIFLEKEKIESEYNLVRKEGNNLFAEVFLKNLFDGKGAYVFVKASPLYDDKGNIVGAIESIRDITERKEIEQDLKESEEKYRWLFEASPLYLILVGLDGRLMDVNQAACDFVGTSKEDLICKHFSELGIMPEEELPL